MKRVIGYMVTFTTYGTWLQGDERRYVKNGKVLEGNERLLNANKKAMPQQVVRLTRGQKEIVRQAILNEAKELRQELFAISVWSNHIHIAAENIDEPIDKIVGRYKAAATKALTKTGFEGKVWTRGYDKQFCFDDKSLNKRIAYVQKHNQTE